MRDKVARNDKGIYRRDLGWKVNPDTGATVQHRFYLGTDRAQAYLRSARLEEVWSGVEKYWAFLGRPAGGPVWDKDTLAIAQAVARGESQVTLPQPGVNAPAETQVAWLATMQNFFPAVRLTLADAAAQASGEAVWARRADEGAQVVKALRQTEQTLHEAFDAYSDWLRGFYKTPEGRLSTLGTAALVRVKTLKQHTADRPLATFDLSAIESVFIHFKNRPQAKKSGRPMTANTVKDMLKRFRHFIKWLHKSSAFEWRKPADYEAEPVRVPLLPGELAGRLSPNQVRTYAVDQLATLFKTASPMVRAWICLALNCGFGGMEVATLRVSEVDLEGGTIRRLRTKSAVYGEWRLWDVTVQAIHWLLSQRPRGTKETALVLNGKGKPLNLPTKSDNVNQTIPNCWNRLTAKVRAEADDFPGLSFNKLRKTSGDMIRRVSDGETAGVFLCHGQPVRSDSLSDVYTNRDFAKVFAAIDRAGEAFAPVFAGVAAPFAVRDWLATRERIKTMRAEGKTYAAIDQALGMSRGCARYLHTHERAAKV